MGGENSPFPVQETDGAELEGGQPWPDRHLRLPGCPTGSLATVRYGACRTALEQKRQGLEWLLAASSCWLLFLPRWSCGTREHHCFLSTCLGFQRQSICSEASPTDRGRTDGRKECLPGLGPSDQPFPYLVAVRSGATGSWVSGAVARLGESPASMGNLRACGVSWELMSEPQTCLGKRRRVSGPGQPPTPCPAPEPAPGTCREESSPQRLQQAAWSRQRVTGASLGFALHCPAAGLSGGRGYTRLPSWRIFEDRQVQVEGSSPEGAPLGSASGSLSRQRWEKRQP